MNETSDAIRMKEITEAIKILFAAYPHFNSTSDTVAVYVAALSSVPIENLRRGIATAITSGREFCPPAGVLLEMSRASSDLLPDIDMAWAEVSQQIRTAGWNRIPEFTHPLIASTVKGLGRWADICATEIDQLGVLRGQFARMYESAKARAEREAKAPQVDRLVQIMALPAGQTRRINADDEIKRLAQAKRIQ